MVILIDCDNFFASCERVMQPQLAHVPVAVLSNNDGCVIARTNDVKAAGVTMGQPYHECKATLDAIGATVVSANFLLYRHFAKRLQTILRALPSTSIEVYSIDESFVELPDTSIANFIDWGATLRKTVDDWIGLPVSIGIAPTRALAKLASEVAKKNGVGVCQLGDDEQTEIILKNTPVSDIWGIGRRLSPKLRLCGITTAWDLMKLEPTNPALKLLDVPILQLIAELRGWPALAATAKGQRKSIMHSRSFGTKVSNVSVLRSVFVDFSSQLSAKLRSKDLVADRAIFSVRYKIEGRKHGVSKAVVKRFAWTNNTFDFAAAAEQAALQLFEKDSQYTKAMVLCPSLRHGQQLTIYESAEPSAKKESLMQAIDMLEQRYGTAGPHIGTKLLNDSWQGKRQFVSPYNHAAWNKLPPVKAS